MLIIIILIIMGLVLRVLYDSTTNRHDAPFVPTEIKVVNKMLDVAGVKKGDILYDLGSGDGRILIAACDRGAKAVGIELDWLRALKSNFWIKIFGLSSEAIVLRKNFFDVDVSRANVVTLFLLPDANAKLKTKLLKELKSGSRIVSYAFTFENWKPVKVETMADSIFGKIYLYATP